MDNEIKKEEHLKHFDIPSLPHRRKLNGDEITYLAKLCSNVFNSTVEPKFIEMIMNYTSFVEKKMIGRIASHVDDLIIHYLMRYFSTLNAREPISDLCHMEIGVLFGGSVLLAHHAIKLADKNIPIHVIEPFEGYYGKGKDIITKEDITETNFVNNLGVFDVPRNHIHIHKGLSSDSKIIKKCDQFKVLSLLIDGDHSYNGIKNDWINYAHLVVPGGYLLIDNYNDQYWPEVMKFMNDEVLPNLHGRWEVACFYASSLLLRRTNVQGTVDISEQNRLFQEVVTKDKKLVDVQKDLETIRKVQSEKIKSLEESLTQANKLSDELRSQRDRSIATHQTELTSLREEKQKIENEYKKQLDSLCDEKVKQIEQLRSEKDKLESELKNRIEKIQLEKDRREVVFGKQIMQLRSEKDKLESELKNRIEKIQLEKDKGEIEFIKQMTQLRTDNQVVEAWLKDQIIQIMTEKKNSEAWHRKQLDEVKKDRLNTEQKLQSTINSLNGRSQEIQTKYNNLSYWHNVIINSLSWKITAPIRKMKEIIFPKWKG